MFCLTAIAAAYVGWGWSHDLLAAWWDTLSGEYVQDYFYVEPLPRVGSAGLFLGYFVLGAGGLAVLSLLRAIRRSPWQRTVANVTLC